MELILNYDRKDTFGNRVFTSDKTSFVSEHDIDMAFKHFKKDAMSAIHFTVKDTEVYSFIWEHYEDCENGVVSVIYSPQWNIREAPKKMNVAIAKRLAKKLLAGEVA